VGNWGTDTRWGEKPWGGRCSEKRKKGVYWKPDGKKKTAPAEGNGQGRNAACARETAGKKKRKRKKGVLPRGGDPPVSEKGKSKACRGVNAHDKKDNLPGGENFGEGAGGHVGN